MMRQWATKMPTSHSVVTITMIVKQIVFHIHNKMTYIPRPPKPLAYDAKGEIMTEGLVEYLLENVQVKHILTE